MEDDDLEGKVTESSNTSEEKFESPEEKSVKSEETLKRTSEVLEDPPGTNRNELETEDNKEDRCSSSEDSPGKNIPDEKTSKIVFKGFKKRILAQARENRIEKKSNSPKNFHATSKSSKEKRGPGEGKRGKITEYAQYLGLQPAPTSRPRCPNCPPSSNTCANSMLKNQQSCTCPPGSPQSPGTSDNPPALTAPTSANNFRITRKVYLCAACGTYFENWNLFLHMREIHKRHICLFCLGMFGQAERLSYHLAKKHSVPETSFSSVEDFYNVFKGSCYLMCCTCEKVFSETDNFYNHFCSPVQKSRNNAAEVCSICRQTGNHATTCSLVETGIPGIPGKNSESPSNRNSSKRMLKNNRLKRSEETLLASYQQKLSDMYARKMTGKSRDSTSSLDEPVAAVSRVESLETATTTTDIDTVSETIMEVSKFTEDTRRNESNEDINEEISQINSSPSKNESSPCPSISPSRSPSPLRQPSEEVSLYDSVAETIMEVSRCDNESEANTSEDEDDEEDNEEDNSRDAGSDADVLIMDEFADAENATRTTNGKEDYDDRLKDSTTRNAEANDEQENDEANDVSDSDDSSRSSRSPHSRTNRASESYSSPEKESHTTVTTVNSTDRSLVIKICTNRNSQFSVTSANGSSLINENHDAGHESEENNNGEDSASEGKVSNNGSVNSFHGDDDEEEDPSDAESTKNPTNAIENTEQTIDLDENKEKQNPTKEEEEEEGKIEVENIETPQKLDNNIEETKDPTEIETNPEKDIETVEKTEQSDGIILATEDVPTIDLNVEGTLDSMKTEDLLKRCISAASIYCVYCNHARRIAVNGKQLSLHVLAEHRFEPQHPAIIIQREQFVARLKKSLEEVETFFFNLDSFDSARGTYDVPNPRTFECFHCRYHSLVHKDIYLHNRKMHQKTILICIMCKSTFYSYSELLCHLCPGVYSPNINVTYRCCLCPVTSLPSAFRLMVHLRKRHHSCDVCLESTGNQQRLSNHVWKHKLHHLCYRCGIAYRNKPDITKHLFWKHGTESVLCKKCLQKKWPHVYHFCIPPTAFVCEECTSTFTRAVALKVHKRLHTGDRPYGCEECSERFISKKLLAKHEARHREPEIIPEIVTKEPEILPPAKEEEKAKPVEELPIVIKAPSVENLVVDEPKEIVKEVKKIVDVYDLPPLNLSSDSDTDSEDQSREKPLKSPSKDATDAEAKNEKKEEVISTITEAEPEEEEEEKKEEAQIMDGIWDNFKSYAASLEKQDSVVEMITEEKKEDEIDLQFLCRVILADHDYCVVSEKTEELKEDPTAKIDENNGTMGGEHDYGYKAKSPSSTSIVLNCDSDANSKKKKEKSPKKKKSGSGSSSDSSSDSDSSSCSCGTNCSCSSSSSGSSSSSSSSSDSDSSASESSPKKQSVRKERRKEKDKEKELKEDEEETEEKKEPPKSEIIEEKVETAQVAIEDNPEQNIEDPNQSVEICDPPKSPQVVFQESDLDTDETETDEDFYDEHPQQLANKLLAEKRNQLMLLAAVAPAATELPSAIPATPNNLNNGTLEPLNSNPLESPSTKVNEVVHNSGRQGRKRVKTKKRKKSDKAKTSRVSTPTVESIKLNIPKSFYQKKHPGYGSSQPAMITVLPSRSSTPNFQNSQNDSSQFSGEANKSLRLSIGGSGSENENKRSSKRKRVPKRFYGDSSDEEAERQQQQQQQQQQHYNQPSLKWRKVEPPPVVPAITIPVQPQIQANATTNYATKSVTLRLSGFDQPLERIVPMTTVASATESEEPAETSSDSSEAEETAVEAQPQQSQQPTIHHHPVGPPMSNALPTNSSGVPGERSANLYCYCQCPYDEVSEMIACDGDDCRIEWFHFECVGIMVPPKGKWYCPDCRKKDESLPGNEEYFD